MDNNNNNRLSEENQKWLDDLLNTPDSQEVGVGELAKQFAKPEAVSAEPQKEIADDEQPIREAEALVADQDTPADIDDVDWEKILSEDWLNEGETANQEEAVPTVLEEDVSKDKPKHTVDTAQSHTDKSENVQQDQKRRPKRTDGYGLWGIPHILSTVIWVALILAIGLSLGRVLWVCCADKIGRASCRERVLR